MKRFLSFILCLILVSSVVLTSCKNDNGDAIETTAGQTTSGEDNNNNTPDNNKKEDTKVSYEIRDFANTLISYWDFKGDTTEQMLTDKANAGASTDKISIFGYGTSVSWGKLTVTDGPGNYASVACDEGSDLYDLANKTVIFKARLRDNEENGYSGLVAGIFSKKSAYTLYYAAPSLGRTSNFTYQIGGTSTTDQTTSPTPRDTWITQAVTVEMDAEAKKAKLTLYKSTVADPESYEDFEIVSEITVRNVSDASMKGTDLLYIGKRASDTSKYRTLDSDFAAIQVYDMVLNPAELATIDLDIDSVTAKAELDDLIVDAERIDRTLQSDYEWNSFVAVLTDAKKITVDDTPVAITEMNRKLKRQIDLVTIRDVPNKTVDLYQIPYNNPGLQVPIDAGMHTYSGFYDIDNDGDMDFISGGSARSYSAMEAGGLFAYRNTNNQVGTTSFSNAQLLQSAPNSPWYSYKSDGSSVFVINDGIMYDTVTNVGFENGVTFDKLSKKFKLYDIDGDGISDAVFIEQSSIGENTYDSSGNSNITRSSTIKYIKNTGTENEPIFNSGTKSIRNKAASVFMVTDPSQYAHIVGFSMFDWDGDGDLDLIAGGWLDKYFYYENVGSATNPIFDNVGVVIETVSGPINLDNCRYNIINYDWDGDGKDDIMISGESGTTLYLRFTGNYNSQTGAPIFEDGVYFTCEAEYLSISALSRPAACDWDGDGDTDYIVGEAGGALYFYENLTGGTDPSWAAPVKLADEHGNVFEIKAGYNGSLQGTQEREWGYTVPSAGDWDGDGDIDIIVNSITGRIVWFENIGTVTSPQLTQPKAIEVEWENGNLYPEWQWWTPEGDELVTQHRSTMCAIDFTGDGLCDLVGLDYEGYLVLYERYNDNGTLKLKQGRRIFVTGNGEALRLTNQTGGASGRVKIGIVDWNCDGKLDVVVLTSTHFEWYRTKSISEDRVLVQTGGQLCTGSIAGHHQGFTFTDWDGDGDMDIVSGTESGYFYICYNSTKQ